VVEVRVHGVEDLTEPGMLRATVGRPDGISSKDTEGLKDVRFKTYSCSTVVLEKPDELFENVRSGTV
jgi:hypothetical protein